MRWLILLTFAAAIASALGAPGQSPRRPSRRSRTPPPVARFDYVVSPSNRTLCQDGATIPPNRINTTQRIADLRAQMAAQSLAAYFIPLEDEHGSSGAAHDARLEYISGFSGSNGWAWVTATEQALWTDGRYFTQADQQMDCNWILMKEGQPGYPTAEQWLLQVVATSSQVGADSKLVGISTWQSYETALATKNITLMEVDDLIDIIWTIGNGRPARANNLVYEHTVAYTGETWQDKLVLIRAELTAAAADLYVMTALDETAWVFNLRGSDFPTSPTFYSYGIVTLTDIRLYLTDYTRLLADVQLHLNTNPDGTCNGMTPPCVNVKEYADVFIDLAADATTHTKLWVDPFSSYRTYSAAGANRYVEYSPVQLMKSIKTDTERTKYKECQIRDSAALVEFVSRLEEDILQGSRTWSEQEVSDALVSLRSEYTDNRGTSFDTIAGVGENGAVIHYRPVPETNRNITTTDLFLLDSGGQYLDGTTDVTRTFHYGTPTQEHIDAYTTVLICAIDLALAVWPEGTYGRDIDAFARVPLWSQGLDFNHGTGHGIAYFINVHEGPGRIAQGYNPAHEPLYEGMFFSDEPGFYKDGPGGYGVRLETIVGVEEAQTPNHFNGAKYLTFEPVTFVPFEKKLIRLDWLNRKQRQWLNDYHARCMETTAVYLQNNRPDAYERAVAWMEARTAAVPLDDCTVMSAGHVFAPSLSVVLLATLAALYRIL